MKVLLVVNASPWGSTLSAAALQFMGALQHAGHGVAAVFFSGDGVYNAVSGGRADPGTADLAAAWAEAAGRSGCELLLCASAWQRRLSDAQAARLASPYRVAGLGELADLLGSSDRVVTL